MTKFNQAIKIFISCWIALLFTGCNISDNETVNENKMSKPIFEEESELVEERDDSVVYEEMWDDLDGNGQMEYIQITNTENGVLEVFFNGQVIYEHVEKQERIVGIGEKEFVVGTATDFTFTTIANDDAGTMVKGSFVFSDPDAIETLEYRESKNGEWYEFYGDFGPATGFPMTDATSQFRVTFKKAGIYTVEAYMKTVEDGTVVCSTRAAVMVKCFVYKY